MSTRWTIPRESVEWVGPIGVPDGATNVEIAVLPKGTRPLEADWLTPMFKDGAPGYFADTLTPGDHYMWLRYVDGPEKPVHSTIGVITIT